MKLFLSERAVTEEQWPSCDYEAHVACLLLETGKCIVFFLSDGSYVHLACHICFGNFSECLIFFGGQP